MMVTSLKLGDNVKEIKDTVVEECVKGNVCNLTLATTDKKKYGSSITETLLNVEFSCNSNSLLTPDLISGAAICNTGFSERRCY